MMRYAYFFDNIFNKIKQAEDWDHISILVGCLEEIVDDWNTSRLFNLEILALCRGFLDEFNQSADLRRDVLTFSENDIKRLSGLMLKSMENS
ncbi:hypothetical protein ACF3OC_08475 [Sphingobacterium cellulitidis]|uniref:hypothetical protein n=1 Tax=Sphingobacterium cellulitidis TaxID=1768011 RepID=UPI00114059C3